MTVFVGNALFVQGGAGAYPRAALGRCKPVHNAIPFLVYQRGRLSYSVVHGKRYAGVDRRTTQGTRRKRFYWISYANGLPQSLQGEQSSSPCF